MGFTDEQLDTLGSLLEPILDRLDPDHALRDIGESAIIENARA